MKIRLSAIFAIIIIGAVLISAVSAVDFIEDSNSTDLQTGNVENLEIKTSDYDYDDTSNNPIKTVLNTDNSDTQADAQSNHVKYVRPDGTDDGGYGTSDNPYKTIKYAVSQSDENDTIFIYEGRYDENSISLTKSLNFVGENKNVIVTSSLNSRNVFESPYKENGNHISLKFENLTFDLIKPGQFNAILYLRNDDRNEIVDCVFTNNDGQYGIWSAAGETVISNCEFRDNTYTSAGNIIYLSGKGFQNLTNVTFDKTSNVGNGVLSLVYVINRPNRVHAENITIEESSGILYGFNIGNNGYGDVNNTLTVKNAKIEYNEVRKSASNQGGCLFLMSGPTKLEITNSTIVNNTVERGIFAGTSNETRFDVNYNLIYENDGNILFSVSSSKPVTDYNMDYNYWGSENPDLGDLNVYVIATNKYLNEFKAIKNKTAPTMNVNVVNPISFEGDDVVIEVVLNDDATGNITVIGIDTEPQMLQGGSTTFTLKNLLPNSYVVTLRYSGDDRYRQNDYEIAFIVKSIHDTDIPVGCYKILNGLINGNDFIELDKNYEINSSLDSSLKDGILINKKVVIDGKGFSINTTSDARLFNIGPQGDMTLKNVVLLNYNPQSASAITNGGKLMFDNVTFTTQKQVAAGNLNAAIVNSGELIVNNSNFVDSLINCSGNGLLYVYGLLIRNSGTLMIENTNIANNGIVARASTVQIHGGIIYNSGRMSFNKVNMTGSFIHVKSSVSTVFGFVLGESNNSDISIFSSNFEDNEIINDATTNSAMTNVLRASNGDLEVYNSRFINNTGSLNGGAIGYYSQKELIIENNLFDSNSATIQGGAIFLSGNLKSNNNTFRNNFAGRNGGAMYVYGYYDTKNPELGNVVSTNDLFEYNWVESSPDAYGQASILSWGGAICSKAGNLTLYNDTFYKNKALMGDGGALANYLSSWLQVSHCIFKENEATRWDVWTHASGLGGAILIPQTEMVDDDNYATFNIEYSIFDNNIAIAGSALYSVPYQDVPCDFISNNNYWGSNDPFFKELIGKYQLSDVVFPDNYVIMEIEGNETVYVGSSNTYKITLNKVNENGTIRELGDVMPDWEVKLSSTLNPLSDSSVLIKGSEADFQYEALKSGSETFSVNNRYYKKNIEVIKMDSKLELDYVNTANGVSVNVYLADDINGTVSVELNGQTYNESVNNGVASFTLPKLPIGNTNITVSFGGNGKYNSFSQDKQITIEKYVIDESQVETGLSASNVFTVTLPKDATGRVLFDVDGRNFYANIRDGIASLDLSSLGEVKSIKWTYPGDEKYGEINGSFSVNTAVKIMGNRNMIVFYSDNSVFKVQIVDSNGKPVGEGRDVSFKINNKVINAKTDKNGFASFKINQVPKKYTIITKCGNAEVKNTVTVKKVLFAKNISKKKSKKIKYTAKIKGKKPFKGKKVTFKINGKKYSAKTNKKGIATVYLKNLKVGKHKIVIKYMNTKVTKTVKIKK